MPIEDTTRHSKLVFNTQSHNPKFQLCILYCYQHGFNFTHIGHDAFQAVQTAKVKSQGSGSTNENTPCLAVSLSRGRLNSFSSGSLRTLLIMKRLSGITAYGTCSFLTGRVKHGGVTSPRKPNTRCCGCAAWSRPFKVVTCTQCVTDLHYNRSRAPSPCSYNI